MIRPSGLQNLVMSLSVLNYCICAFLCCSRIFNPSLCHLSPFLLSCPVCCVFKALLELYPDRSSMICECRVFGCFEWLAMIGEWCPIYQQTAGRVTRSTKACPPKYSKKLLKPCWIRILKATWPWNSGDKRPDEMATNHILYYKDADYTNCQQGQGLLLWIYY